MHNMSIVNKNELKQRLIDEGYIEEYGLDRTVENLINLEKLENKAAYEMLCTWLKTGKIQKFESIGGIDLKFLRDELHMKNPAIILAYGMLLYDPEHNAIALKREKDRRNCMKPAKL